MEDPRAKGYAGQCAQIYSQLSDSLAGSYLVANCFVLMEDSGQALTALESAVKLGWTDADALRAEASFDSLKNDPRWLALIARLEAP